MPAAAKSVMARAVSESSLLAGRLEFFDLQQPDMAKPSFTLALQAAGEAEDELLGAATLAHMAFAPAFSGDPKRAEDARDKLHGARAFARRGSVSTEMLAWLDAVEAEVETHFGNTRRALELIAHAEEMYEQHDADGNTSPPWLNWFSPTRLAGFKGNTLLAAQALEQLGEQWYATAMDRVKDVRRTLRAWDSLPQMRALDDHLYNWHTMIRSLSA